MIWILLKLKHQYMLKSMIMMKMMIWILLFLSKKLKHQYMLETILNLSSSWKFESLKCFSLGRCGLQRYVYLSQLCCVVNWVLRIAASILSTNPEWLLWHCGVGPNEKGKKINFMAKLSTIYLCWSNRRLLNNCKIWVLKLIREAFDCQNCKNDAWDLHCGAEKQGGWGSKALSHIS